MLTAQRCFWKHVKSHSAFCKKNRTKNEGGKKKNPGPQKRSLCRVNNTPIRKKKKKNTGGSTVDCRHNSQYHDRGSKGGIQWRGVKWRGGGDPWIHIVKSDSLSPPDKSPLDKCGQAAEGASFSSDGVQDGDKNEALLGKPGSRARRPQAEKLSQQQRSFQLVPTKPLKKFTHRHSPYSANIG